MNAPLIFCAVDTADIDRALALAAAMQKSGCGVKLGLEFFNGCGPDGVREIRRNYPEIPLFLDLKFHDIPNTVAAAIRASCALEPQFLNVHAAGGAAMMKAAREAAQEGAARQGVKPPKLLAVTVLTSMAVEDLKQTGVQAGSEAQVKTLTGLALQNGMDGVVCSGHEAEILRASFGASPILMVPGIRPAGADSQDQKRVMTPQEAMQAGATHLVIGRPITGAENPAAAATAILADIETTRLAKKTGS